MTRSAKGCGGDAFPGVIDSTSDVGPDSNDDPDLSGDDSFSVDFGNTFGDDDDDEHPGGTAGEHALSINAISGDFGELGADLSPWAPLLGMLDSTEPEASPGDRPFTPTEGVEGAHALELRAESMLQYSERGAERTGELDRTEVGVSDDNRDVVAGRDQVEIDGMLNEHTGHGLVHVADEVELNVGGPLHMHAHLEDNIIMAGVMTDEWKGGTFITAAMSDDMAAGLGLRCTAPPLDLTEPEDVDLEGVDDVQHAPAADDDGHSGSTTARSVATGGEDANPTGTLSGPDDSSTASRRGNGPGPGPGPGPSGTPSRITPGTPDPVFTSTPRNARVTDATPAGASASDAVAGAAGTRSDLYNEPVSFEGRSLEGTPLSDDSKELAQSLDGAEIPVEDLPPVEPGPAGPRRKSILKHADDMPDPGLSYVDEDEAITDRRIEYARNTRGRSDRNADTVWRRARNRKEAVDAANARWSEFAAAKRTSSTSFSDDPRQVLYLVEHETTLYSNTGEKIADVYRGVDPPNTLDRSHAAHFIPRPRGWEPAHETGFGRLSQGWNEFPFSHRERILNTLSKGESLIPEQIAALESGLEGYRAA